MADKLQQILNLVDEYVTEREENKSWIPGQDWVSYSGPVYDRDEYMSAVEVLLSGWLIFGMPSSWATRHKAHCVEHIIVCNHLISSCMFSYVCILFGNSIFKIDKTFIIFSCYSKFI